MRSTPTFVILALSAALAACGGSSNSSAVATQNPETSKENTSPLTALSAIPLVGGVLGDVAGGVPDDPKCGSYSSPSAEFTACEVKNFARISEAPREELTNPIFVQRLFELGLVNTGDYLMRALSDPSRLLLSPPMSVSLNTPLTPLCATYALPCSGDPFRYPDIDPFYKN